MDHVSVLGTYCNYLDLLIISRARFSPHQRVSQSVEVDIRTDNFVFIYSRKHPFASKPYSSVAKLFIRSATIYDLCLDVEMVESLDLVVFSPLIVKFVMVVSVLL